MAARQSKDRASAVNPVTDILNFAPIGVSVAADAEIGAVQLTVRRVGEPWRVVMAPCQAVEAARRLIAAAIAALSVEGRAMSRPEPIVANLTAGQVAGRHARPVLARRGRRHALARATAMSARA